MPLFTINVCPHCQAQNQPNVTRCWMCGATLGNEEIIEAEVVRPDEGSGYRFALTAALVVVAMISVAFGLWRESPGFSVLWILVTAPAISFTLVRAIYRRSQGEKASGWKAVLDFILSAAVMVFVVGAGLVLLAICVIVLILRACGAHF